MIPTVIPDDEVWQGATRRVIGPPAGMEPWDVHPVEVLSEFQEGTGAPLIHVRIAFEPDDVRRIKEGTADHFWLTLWSDHLHAFAVQLPMEEETDGVGRTVDTDEPDGGLDYQDLLRRYIDHVGDCEGTTFTSDLYRDTRGGDRGRFTDVEWADLQRLEGETRA